MMKLSGGGVIGFGRIPWFICIVGLDLIWCRLLPLSDFIHAIVVHRRDEAIGGWRNWVREDPLVHLYGWLRPDLVLPTPFLQCEPHLSLGGSGVLSDPVWIDEEFRKAWLPYFCRSGQRKTNLDEFGFEVDGWLPLSPEVHLPRLTGQMLADVVQQKSATAGSRRSCLFRGLMNWLAFFPRLRMLGSGLLDAYIAMFPKQMVMLFFCVNVLKVSFLSCRIWASARMGHLDGLVQVLGS